MNIIVHFSKLQCGDVYFMSEIQGRFNFRLFVSTNIYINEVKGKKSRLSLCVKRFMKQIYSLHKKKSINKD